MSHDDYILYRKILFFQNYSNLFVTFSISNERSELLKTKLKKETLETEIELLENHIKLKRQELRHSCTSLADEGDMAAANRLSCSVDTQQYKQCHKSPKPCAMDPKNPFTYDDVVKLMNERDILRHRLSVDKASKDIERRGLESQIDLINCELTKSNKNATDKIIRLEEVTFLGTLMSGT